MSSNWQLPLGNIHDWITPLKPELSGMRDFALRSIDSTFVHFSTSWMG
jgi:hypothetical protein